MPVSPGPRRLAKLVGEAPPAGGFEYALERGTDLSVGTLLSFVHHTLLAVDYVLLAVDIFLLSVHFMLLGVDFRLHVIHVGPRAGVPIHQILLEIHF